VPGVSSAKLQLKGRSPTGRVEPATKWLLSASQEYVRRDSAALHHRQKMFGTGFDERNVTNRVESLFRYRTQVAIMSGLRPVGFRFLQSLHHPSPVAPDDLWITRRYQREEMEDRGSQSKFSEIFCLNNASASASEKAVAELRRAVQGFSWIVLELV